MIEQLHDIFVKKFGGGGDIFAFFAPGRVNLIGEHTDYNGGHVFPCALNIGTYGIARKRNDRNLRFFSTNFEQLGIIDSSLDDLRYYKEADWTNYVKGVILAFKEKGFEINMGMDFLFSGTIPNQSGLSSSASLEVLTSKILIDLYNFNVDMIQAALFCQYAENHFVGVNCGIMDQFAIAMGKENHAIYLDTATLDYQYVPANFTGFKIVIGNTNKSRGLEDSKYNERRSECESALKEICKIKPIKSLGDLSSEEFESVAAAIDNSIWKKRARHAVYENERTIKAVEALKNKDYKQFGQLLNASHISLRDDYEVTGLELDTMVEAAWQQEGVIGSRMTGAGFGGCTVSIVKNDYVDQFIHNVGKIYNEKIGYDANFYVVEIGHGPKMLANQ